MKRFEDKVVLVVGAASGIGRTTALAFADEGARLMLADLDEDGLHTVAKEAAERSACLLAQRVDVSKTEDMAALAEAVHEAVPCVDVLVNSAGVYITGGILDLSLEDWDWVLSINLHGLIHGCHYFIPPMARRGQGGHVVNLASMYGYWTSPQVVGYLTSKFGVFGFSEALREDLRPYGVRVSTVCPGMINTGLVNRMRIRHTACPEESRGQLADAYQHRNYGPEKVAHAIVDAVYKKRKMVLVSPESRIMYRLERWCPALSRAIARSAAKRMFGNPSPAQTQGRG